MKKVNDLTELKKLYKKELSKIKLINKTHITKKDIIPTFKNTSNNVNEILENRELPECSYSEPNRQPSGIIYEPEKDVTYLIRPTYFLLRIRIPARHK